MFKRYWGDWRDFRDPLNHDEHNMHATRPKLNAVSQ